MTPTLLELLPRFTSSVSEGESYFVAKLTQAEIDLEGAIRVYVSYLQARSALMNPSIHAVCWNYFDEDVGDFAYDSFLDSIIFCGIDMFLTGVFNPLALLRFSYLGMPLDLPVDLRLCNFLNEDEAVFFRERGKSFLDSGLVRDSSEDVTYNGMAGNELFGEASNMEEMCRRLREF